MRPRRERLGCLLVEWSARRSGCDPFNEAEARTPRMPRHEGEEQEEVMPLQ